MSRREKISAVDTAWLRMDRPGNPMMICGVLLLRERVELERLKATIAERFLRFERFLDGPVQRAGIAFWQRARDFDLAAHVVAIRLPARAGKRELEVLASRLAGTPLDPSRPLWQFHLVERYDGGSAVIVRIHHCYADGIALVQVMLSMTDAAAAGPPAMPPPKARASNAREPDLFGWLSQPLGDALKVAGKVGGILIEKGVALWQDPAKAVKLAHEGSALTREIATLAMMGEDSPTRFKGIPGGTKRVAWAEPIPLDEIKTVGKALGASVNDVLLACVAGAMGRYLAAKGDALDHVMVRALVPVNLRPLEKAYRLGNQFGLVFLALPIGIRNPIERLYAVRHNMQALKGSYQPVLALGLLAAMGAGPKLLQDQLLEALARNATAVMTNVPGPQQALYIAGARIDSLMFWVPQSGNIGMGASIISFNGTVQFGLITDRAICPDPEEIVSGFAKEFETLVLTTLLSPWPWDGDLPPQVAEEAIAAR